jgi:hypothetical protein
MSISQTTSEERMKREQLQMEDEGDDAMEAEVIDRDRDRQPLESKPLVTPPELPRTEQSPAPSAGASVPNAGFGTPDFSGHDPAQTRDRWQQIQAAFVDDPRKAVGDAHALVGDLVQRIVDSFTHERNELESQWSKGSDVSTEDLRVCLQHYREFFARLLPSANGTPSHT